MEDLLIVQKQFPWYGQTQPQLFIFEFVLQCQSYFMREETVFEETFSQVFQRFCGLLGILAAESQRDGGMEMLSNREWASMRYKTPAWIG